jgi:hypothetical protein
MKMVAKKGREGGRWVVKVKETLITSKKKTVKVRAGQSKELVKVRAQKRKANIIVF